MAKTLRRFFALILVCILSLSHTVCANEATPPKIGTSGKYELDFYVKDQKGKPVANAKVQLYVYFQKPEFKDIRPVRPLGQLHTNDHGKVVFPQPIDIGALLNAKSIKARNNTTWQVGGTVEHVSIRNTRTPLLAPTIHFNNDDSPARAELVIPVLRLQTRVGIAVDRTDTPLPNARIITAGGDSPLTSVRTDSEGKFEIKTVPGAKWIFVETAERQFSMHRFDSSKIELLRLQHGLRNESNWPSSPPLDLKTRRAMARQLVQPLIDSLREWEKVPAKDAQERLVRESHRKNISEILAYVHPTETLSAIESGNWEWDEASGIAGLMQWYTAIAPEKLLRLSKQNASQKHAGQTDVAPLLYQPWIISLNDKVERHRLLVQLWNHSYPQAKPGYEYGLAKLAALLVEHGEREQATKLLATLQSQLEDPQLPAQINRVKSVVLLKAYLGQPIDELPKNYRDRLAVQKGQMIANPNDAEDILRSVSFHNAPTGIRNYFSALLISAARRDPKLAVRVLAADKEYFEPHSYFSAAIAASIADTNPKLATQLVNEVMNGYVDARTTNEQLPIYGTAPVAFTGLALPVIAKVAPQRLEQDVMRLFAISRRPPAESWMAHSEVDTLFVAANIAPYQPALARIMATDSIDRLIANPKTSNIFTQSNFHGAALWTAMANVDPERMALYAHKLRVNKSWLDNDFAIREAIIKGIVQHPQHIHATTKKQRF